MPESQPQHQFPWRGVGVALIVVTALLALMITNVVPSSSGTWDTTLTVGYFVGCFYAQSTLVAIWLVFGPVAVKYRMLGAIAWTLFLLANCLAFVSTQGGGVELQDVSIFAGIVLGQILVAFLIGYGFRIFSKLSIGLVDLAHETNDARFGTRQLMIFTGVAAGFFAIVRGILSLPAFRATSIEDFGVMGLLGLTGIVCCYGFVVATLLQHRALLAVVFALLVVAAISFIEMQGFEALETRGGAGGPGIGEILAINFMMSFFCILYSSVMRAAGFRMVRRPRTTP